jgi:hypothetical protein
VQNNRYDILDGLPAYGPMYVPISEDGIPFYSQGYVVRFYKSDGTSWVANFKAGWTNLSGIYDFPEFKRTIVFAFGQCYIMADDEQNSLKAFGVGFTNVYKSDDNILIVADQTEFTVIEICTDQVWRSERISWDGFDDLNFNGDFITGLAFEPNSDDGEWKPFSFNYRTKEIIGGTYQFQTNSKPWWKIW